VLVCQAKFPGRKSKVNERIKIASGALLGTLVVNRERAQSPLRAKPLCFQQITSPELLFKPEVGVNPSKL